MTDASAGAKPGASAPELAFNLLGSLQVLHRGEPVQLGGRQQKAVLARMLIEPGTVLSTERLADAIWGEDVPDAAVATIQTYVSHLRETLEPHVPRADRRNVVVTEARGYRLQVHGATVDAIAFEEAAAAGRAELNQGSYAAASERLAAALSLWRGPVLADLSDYDFVQEAARRLDTLRLDAIEDRIDADLALGRHREVAGELGRLVAEHPLRERLQGQLMLARYRCGQQVDALTQFQQLRETLAEELGIDPNRELQRLHEAILRQDPDLDRTAPRIPLVAALVRPEATAAAPSTAALPEAQEPARPRSLAATIVLLAVTAVLAVSTVSSDSGLRRPQPQLVGLAPNTVGRVDADGRLTAQVTVGQGPTALATGAGGLWAANVGASTVSRIDPDTGQLLQTIEVGRSPDAIAVSGESVWVANGGDGTVSRINAGALKSVQTVNVGNIPSALAVGSDAVWVANRGDDTIQRIDAGSGAVGTPIDVGGQPAGLAVKDGTVWVTNSHDGTVSRVDGVTGQVESPIRVGTGPTGIAATPDSVWVANSLDLTVTHINRKTGQVMDTIPVGDGPHSVLATSNGVWISNEYAGELVRIDPKTNTIVQRVPTRSSPRGLASSGSAVWVASSSGFSDAHRGGTLTVEGNVVPGFDGIDPAGTYVPNVFTMVYDSLVGFRRTGGSAGLTLVPDLAVSLPIPTNGYRTYSFTVRRGIHYSNGAELTPGDLRRGVIRALAREPMYYLGIKGARACAADPKACDLAEGVVVNDARSTITFNLERPDPDFLAKLSVHVYAIPPGIAPGPINSPVPGTGPYMIRDYAPVKVPATRPWLTLVRNPKFKVWSSAAKPDGHPDVIQFHQVKDQKKRADDIVSERADLTDPSFASFTNDVAADLERQHTALVHSEPLLSMLYEWMNTRVPPFNDVRVRQALNLAVDRNEIIARSEGSSRLSVTCQVYPPNFPGYEPYCPYSRDRQADQAYRGPDIGKAQQLVDASGTKGMRVVVLNDGPNDALGPYFVSVLRHLGYRASSKVNDDRFRNSDLRQQMGSGWWGVDYPAPSNIWGPLFSCGAFVPHSDANGNWSEYCNPAVDAVAKRALEMQNSDAAAARRLWNEVDRRITDDAPWVAGPVTRSYVLASPRLGNYQSNPVIGPLVDQMWVQ